MTPNQPDAVIFDFDGTIFDSETPIYRAYAAALAEVGLELTIPGWATVVGHGEEDSHRALVAAVGVEFERDDVEARYRRQPRPFDSLPALPGVEALFAELVAADIPIGVASSSSESWVHTHLTRLGLRHHVQVIATRDQVDGRTKPDPASYRYAIEQLGADPARTVAIEDSAPGIAAALGAGLTVVVVPSEITQHTDLSAAHHTASSMEALDLATLTVLLDEP